MREERGVFFFWFGLALLMGKVGNSLVMVGKRELGMLGFVVKGFGDKKRSVE